MNAPLRHRASRSETGALNLFAFFHLNLAFSSIEESQRETVIKRCYWPLLEFARSHGPTGIEATGFTLEEIAARDPGWIEAARELIAAGRVELIGSGYAQIIGPLVPARLSLANLRIGAEIYRRLLGVEPEIALVNEQAYSSGLVGLYLDAGYRAILMDWDNPSAHHPEWPAETRYCAQRAEGSDGRSIGLLWTNTVAFQKLQRYVHGDIDLDDYLEFARGHRGGNERVLCAYASDGEIFDFRPGRYRTEENISASSEWLRLSEAFGALVREQGISLISPSQALASCKGGAPLHLGTASCPIPVKKQRKYNLSRWAVTGRDDLAINAACQRIHDGLCDRGDDAAWKELCYLWSSDFRTHITERRWLDYCARLEAAEARWSCGSPRSSAFPELAYKPVTSRQIAVETPTLSACLDRRRGLAMSAVRFAGQSMPSIGGLPHGHFDDIALQADWYTGDCVFEAPGEHKVTDLELAQSVIAACDDGTVVIRGTIGTPKGPIEKVLVFHASKPQIDFDLTFHWQDWGKGSLRLGHFTLLPDAFDWSTLLLTTHNGGKECETFRLAGSDVDHGAPVSFLVSASHGIGMTEGWAELGDARHGIRVEVERSLGPLLGLVTHRRVGGSLFCQLALSALELDDTRKPSAYRAGPRRFRFSVKSRN
jgi:hypothetical protein